MGRQVTYTSALLQFTYLQALSPSQLLFSVNTMKVFLMSVLVVATMADPELKESGLKVESLSKPDSCDKVARNGDMLSMHYVGTLESGAKFDSSYDRSEPFKFQIGVGQVIKGWEEGVLGMCVGEKRRLIIPPALGYGDQGAGDIIPGDATLFFDVELISTIEGQMPVNVFKHIDLNKDMVLSKYEISSYLKQQVETMLSAGVEQEEVARKMMDDQEKYKEKLVEEIFAHEDKDNDGFISHDEFTGPKHDEL